LKLKVRVFLLISAILVQTLLAKAEPTPISFKAAFSGLTAERDFENVKAELSIDGSSFTREFSNISRGSRLKVVFEDLRLNSSSNWVFKLKGTVGGVNATLFWARGLINLEEGKYSIRLLGYDFNPDLISIDAESSVITFTSVKTTGTVAFLFKANLTDPTAYTSVLALDLDGDGLFSDWETTVKEGFLEGDTLNVSSIAFSSYMPLANFALNLSFNGRRVAALVGSINFTSGDLVSVRSEHDFNYSLIVTITFTPILSNSILNLKIAGEAFTVEGNGTTTTTRLKPIRIIVTTEEGVEARSERGQEQLSIGEFASRLNQPSLILFLALVLGMPALAVSLLLVRGWMKRLSRRRSKP